MERDYSLEISRFEDEGGLVIDEDNGSSNLRKNSRFNYKMIFLLILIVILSFFFIETEESYNLNYKNIKSSDQFLEAQKIIKKWSDDYNVVTPELIISVHFSNEGMYSDNKIFLTLEKEDFISKNLDFMEVALAHEFGHHLSRIRNNYDTTEEYKEIEEDYADSIMIKLVGYEKAISVFNKKINKLKKEGNFSYIISLEKRKNNFKKYKEIL